MPECKITVLKTMSNQDLAEEYCQPGDTPRVCPRFTEGQEFMVAYGSQPDESFCDWAWNDIHKVYLTLIKGGSTPSMKNSNVMIACCTDGIQPVIFRLERISD